MIPFLTGTSSLATSASETLKEHILELISLQAPIQDPSICMHKALNKGQIPDQGCTNPIDLYIELVATLQKCCLSY